MLQQARDRQAAHLICWRISEAIPHDAEVFVGGTEQLWRSSGVAIYVMR